MQTNLPFDIQQLSNDTYRAIRQQATEHETVTVLHIGRQYSLIALGKDAGKPDNLWVFEMGSEKTATDFFSLFPPTFNEVENAIMVVEEEVMPLHKLLVSGSGLYTMDAGIREIAQLTVFAEKKQGVILARSDMEQVFNRLAAIITGRPASQDILPSTNSFAATLLILREVMHHLGFRDITIL